MILSTSDIIQFDLSDLILLLFGIGFGLLLAFLLYMFIVLFSIRPKKYIVKARTKGLTEDEIDEKIKFAQEIFVDKDLQGDLSQVAHCKNVCTSLVLDIASVYFPNSKRPLMELSIDEVLMLAVYISERVNGILDHKGLRLFKKFKVATLIGMGDAKKTIDDSSLMKITKKYKLKEAFTTVTGALNVVNPLYWAKKLVVNKTIDFAMAKMCLMIIAITAEETYKIYSKNVFNEDVVIEDKYGNLADEIENELSDISIEDIKNHEEDYNGKEESDD